MPGAPEPERASSSRSGSCGAPARVLVTGASQGIGLAIARRLSADGARIALCASAPSARLERALDAVADGGAEVIAITGDLEDPSVPGQLVAQAVERFGGLDCVVVNAGVAHPAPLVEEGRAEWDRVFAVNVRATWLLAGAAHPHLARCRGSIVAIGSVAGRSPHPGMGAYSASKAAAAMLVRQLAQEFAADGIRVNMVVPGFVHTPRTAVVYQDEELLAERERMVPLGRIADAYADVAEAAAYLAGPGAAYCTGQQLVVDGGLLDSILARDPGPRAYVGAA